VQHPQIAKQHEGSYGLHQHSPDWLGKKERDSAPGRRHCQGHGNEGQAYLGQNGVKHFQERRSADQGSQKFKPDLTRSNETQILPWVPPVAGRFILKIFI